MKLQFDANQSLQLDAVAAVSDRFDTGATSLTQLKANAVQIFKTKGVTSFKTV